MAIIYSVLKVYPFPGTLARDCRLLLGLCVFLGGAGVYAHWHFLVANIFSSKSGVYETKRKPREITTMLLLVL